MFEGLSDRLGGIFDKLRKRGALTEADVSTALREVRIALLEADVALPVVKDFVNKVKERAVGQEVLSSITPGQQVVKIVHDNLVEMLGGGSETVEADDTSLTLTGTPPLCYLMVGLQGSGKTTSTAKIAAMLSKQRKKILLASLDTRRPAAQEQLATLANQVGVASLPIIPGQEPTEITKRALKAARLEGYDILILDTAGRLAIDDELMQEVEAIRDLSTPTETLLVCDAMTGQDAVTVAENFQSRIGLTGIVLTRIDGDARGGAALSMRAITGCPIKLLGTGEKTSAFEQFHPDRIASRILDMGDVVSLVEKAAENFNQEEALKMAEKMQKGKFDMNDLLAQLRQISKMGGMGGLMGFMPGMKKIKKQLDEAQLDDSLIKRQEAIILSMTAKERATPALIKASRKNRIAKGSGTTVQEVNKLLKQHQQMQGMMKKLKKMGGTGGLFGGLGKMLGMGGGMPSPEQLADLSQQAGSPDDLQKGLPQGFPNLGGPMMPPGGGLPPGFPGNFPMPKGGKKKK